MTDLRNKILVLLVMVFAAAFMFPAEAYAIRAQAERLTNEGTELLKLNKLAEAEAKFKAAIDEDGSFDKPYYYMSQVCERNLNHEEAINYIKRALRNSPHEEVYKSFQCDINNAIAAEAIKNGNPDRASKIYFSNLEALVYHMPTYNRLAMLYIGKGDYTNALLQCNKALENSSAMPPSIKFDIGEAAILHANMAACFYEIKNFSRAIAEIEVALKTKDSPYVQKYHKKIMSDDNPVFAELKKAETAFSTGNLPAAREGFERVIGMYPNCSSAVEKIAIIDRKKRVDDIVAEADKLTAATQFSEAIDKYNEVLSVEPQRNDIRDKLKAIESKMGQQQKDALASMRRKPKDTDSADLIDKKLKALVERDQATTDPNKLYETRFREAEDMYNKQDYDNALDKYMSIAEDKDDFKTDEIKKRIRAIHAAKGEFYFESMQTAIPKLYLYLVMLLVIFMLIYVYTGDQIASMFRADPYKFAKKGVELLEKEKYDQAAASFEKSLAMIMDPIERTKIKAKIALCLFKTKDYDKCIKICIEILDVDPKSDVIHGFLGNSYLEKNVQTERAFNEYKLLLKRQKDDKRLLTVLCSQYIQDDNLSQEAIDVYQKVFNMDPKDKRVRKMLCEAFIRSNDKTDLALRVYEAVLTDESNRKDVKLMLISAQFQRKNYEDCIKLCKELFDSGSIENITLEYYTNSFSKLGRKGELYDEYKALSMKYPDSQTLKTYLEKVQSLLNVERLTNRNLDTSTPNFTNNEDQAQQTERKPAAGVPAVNICKSCAHMNPGTLKVCEKCGSAM